MNLKKLDTFNQELIIHYRVYNTVSNINYGSWINEQKSKGKHFFDVGKEGPIEILLLRISGETLQLEETSS